MQRWEEEVLLTLEEMRRVLYYMDWRAQYWQTLTSKRQGLDAVLQEGMAAYAEKQAYIARTMALTFSQRWLPLLEANSFHPDWPERYTVTTYTQ
jgi:hypothetical protein